MAFACSLSLATNLLLLMSSVTAFLSPFSPLQMCDNLVLLFLEAVHITAENNAKTENGNTHHRIIKAVFIIQEVDYNF
jgi:hypothetical protein